MTDGGVPQDMPSFRWPWRRGASERTDAALDALLAGTDAAPELRPVGDVLAALTAEATSDELAGEASAMTEFRRGPGTAAPPRPARRWRPAPRGPALRTRVAAIVGAVALVFGGTVTAAYAGMLPGPMQRIAHDILGAPDGAAPRPHSHPKPHQAPPARVHGAGATSNPHAKGSHGNPHAKGSHGNPHSAGNQGKHKGQGSGNGNGQGNGNGNGGGHGNGNGQGNGNGNGQGNGGGHGNGNGGGKHGNARA